MDKKFEMPEVQVINLDVDIITDSTCPRELD